MTPRADLREHGPAGVLRPGILTYKPRRTRMTPRAERALADRADLLIPISDVVLDLPAIWGPDVPVVLEIGCGDGAATAAMAAGDPGTGVLGVDVHTPGIGLLLASLDDSGASHVRAIEGDALGVLARMLARHSLAGVRTYFPDPWPKARHHKRRIVQSPVRDLVASRVRPGGWWHLATDWAPYAEAMQECFAADPRWRGGAIERPEWRPVTRYERRALLDGRPIVDLLYRFEPAT